MAFRVSRGFHSAAKRATAFVAVAAAFVPVQSAAQTLTLKRDLPDPSAGVCAEAPVGEPGLVTESDRAEASRLASSATQAAIVGDHSGARDLLLRATRLDPEAGGVAYLLGRAYEELGSVTSAMREYCRYLKLTPDAPDAADVEARVATLDPDRGPALPPDAVLQFQRALEAYDLDQYEAAEQAFTAVITAAPRFGPAHYNRALLYATTGRSSESIQDLQNYLQVVQDAEDAQQVAQAVTALRNPPRQYNAGAAMLGSLVVPGTGQFYTGRGLAGFGFMAVAVGAAVFGELSERVQIECRVPPTGGVCDPPDVVAETREKPYRAAGYGTAAAVAVFAAIDAYRGAGRRNAAAGSGLTVAMGPDPSPSFALPVVGLNARGQLTLSLLGFSF